MRRVYLSVLVLIFAMCSGSNLAAQQSAQYTLYHLDKHLVNPAYAGAEPELAAAAFIRNQWLGINGSPAYQHVSVNAPLMPGHSGLGVNFENDQLGLEHNIQASVSYAHRIQLSESVRLSAGVRGIWARKTIDGSKITTPDGVYEPGSNPDHKDGLLPVNVLNGNIFGIGFGILLKSEKFEAGIGADNLVPSAYRQEGISIEYAPAYYLNAGYEFPVTESWKIGLDGLVRYSGNSFQTDAVVKIYFGNNIFAGGSFRGYSNRTKDAASIIAGLRIFENLTLAAAYDIGLSNLRDVHSGSVEFGLRYTYGSKIFREKLPPVIYNPRY